MCLICDRIALIQEGKNPYFVKEMETGYVVIGDHQHFRGYTLFLCKRHETELFHLDSAFRARFMEDMVQVSRTVQQAFHAEKMNYECLGNGDTHLHWHLFPRVQGDMEDFGNHGKGPVWWYPVEKMYADENRPTDGELEEMKAALLNALEESLK